MGARNEDPKAKALEHPLRAQIADLAKLGAISPKEISDRFGRPLPNLSYHFQVLADVEALKLVDTRPVRGSTEHFYRYTAS